MCIRDSGGNVRQLTNNLGKDADPAWSPVFVLQAGEFPRPRHQSVFETATDATRCPRATDTARAHAQNAGELFEAGNYEDAIADLSIAICLDPKSAKYYYNRGRAHSQLGQPTLAIDDYNEAIRLDPQDFRAYNTRGLAYVRLGQHERAIQDFDEAIRLDPEDARVYHSRGATYAALGQSQRDHQE